MNTHLTPDYPEKVYAGWIGKIIGVRYGAPIEMWSSEAIAEFYGELDGYVRQYHDFAADDDTNGPLFFIRALEDYTAGEDLTSEQIGHTILNYVPDHHGFFWWGGYGVSAEHTLYENLSCGIMPPRSGSAVQNGIVVAEQIGGQIFIDSWGLIFPGDYQKAAAYARKAAAVGWDENGIYGGMFVAACVSAAFEYRDPASILEKGLSVIPLNCCYNRMARDIIAFHRTHPKDWRACLAHIKNNYWTDRYQGWCHIIPNGAIIVLALLYGEGDFTKTLNIGNMCGFDTDCNVGNLGTILGVMVGLDGIDFEKWRKPVNDFQACSSIVGSLNITDAPSSALYFVRLAYLAAEEPLPTRLKQLTRLPHLYHFELPGSTQSVRAAVLPDRGENIQISLNNTTEQADSGQRSLKVMATPFAQRDQLKIYVKTYYAKEDFSDGRYQPSFSPILYPGQIVRASVRACPGCEHLEACIFVVDYHTGQMHLSPLSSLSTDNWSHLAYEIPAGDWCVKEAGVLVRRDRQCLLSQNEPSKVGVFVDDLLWEGAPDYTIEFGKEKNWEWEPKPISTELSQFTRHKGIWHLEDGSLRGHCADWGETYTGDVSWRDYRLSAEFTPVDGGWHGVLLRAQGAARSYALCLMEGNRLALLKKEDGTLRTLQSVDYSWDCGQHFTLCRRYFVCSRRLCQEAGSVQHYLGKWYRAWYVHPASTAPWL